MIRKIFILAIFGITAINTYARLGDTYSQSVKRFGEPLIYLQDRYAEFGLFEKANFAIFVNYRNGVAEEEIYASLAPGVKEKLRNGDDISYYDKSELVSNPENLASMSKRHLLLLLKANRINASYPGDLKDAKQAIDFSTKELKAQYIPGTKLLIVAKKVKAADMPISPVYKKNIKAACLPLGSHFKKYYEKLGTPFWIHAPLTCRFKKNNISILTIFNAPDNPDRTSLLIKEMYGGISNCVDYTLLTPEAMKKYALKLRIIQNLNNLFRNRSSLKEDEIKRIEEYNIQLYSNIDDCYSLNQELINCFLENTTQTKWTQKQRSMCKLHYYTWKAGRRIHASYEIVMRILALEFGSSPDDFKPDVIKKLKAQKEAKELESF